MKECTACGHTQQVGNFCGKCGAAFVNTDAEVAATTTANVAADVIPEQPVSTQSSEQLEKIKQQSKDYFNYYLNQLKTPSSHFNNAEANFKNGLISIILYIVLTALACYLLIDNLIGYAFSIFDSVGPSFFKVFFYMAIFLILLVAISLVSVFVTSKLFAEDLSFRNIVGKFGGYYVLPIALSIIGILLIFLDSVGVGSTVLYVGFMVIYAIIPSFVIIKILSHKSKGIDSFYSYLFFLVLLAVITWIILVILVDSTIGQYLEWFIQI